MVSTGPEGLTPVRFRLVYEIRLLQRISGYRPVWQVARLGCEKSQVQILLSRRVIHTVIGSDAVDMRINHYGCVAQLVRAPPCHGGGRGFESRHGRVRLVAKRYQGTVKTPELAEAFISHRSHDVNDVTPPRGSWRMAAGLRNR